MTPAIRLFHLTLASVVTLLITTGCAIQTNRNGQVEYQFDNAELLGKVVQTVRMPDGSQARLRLLDGNLSIKLQKQLTVIPVERAAQAEIVSVHQVGPRAVMRVSKSTPECAHDTQLIALQGREVLSWDFGDCVHTPQTTVYADGITFDFPQDDGNTVRFTYYQEGRLTRMVVPGLPSGARPAPIKPITGGAPRHVPGLPGAPTAGDRPAAANTAPATAPARSPAPEPRPTRTRPSAPPPTPDRDLKFPSQEQKPVRIILDK